MNCAGGTSAAPPPFQRTSASTPHEAAIGEIDFGLVVQHELLLLDRAAQAILEDELAGNPRRHLLGVEEAAIAFRLGPRHGGLGVAQQHVRVRAVLRKQGDPGPGIDAELVAREAERLAEAAAQQLARVARELALAGHAGMGDREVIGADARHMVGMGRASGQARPDLGKQLVARDPAQ